MFEPCGDGEGVGEVVSQDGFRDHRPRGVALKLVDQVALVPFVRVQAGSPVLSSSRGWQKLDAV